jgi:hypothetical protein
MKIAFSGKLPRVASLVALALAPTSFAIAAEPAATAAVEDVGTVIARARAYLGTDAALDAVQSLHFLGMVAGDDGVTRPIEIIMRRPMQEMIIETADKARAVTVLSDYTLWRRVDPIDRPGTGRVQVMNADAVRFTRANVAQTLFYYRGLESVGGTVTVEGEEDIEGVRCVRTVFTHPGDIHYIRFFDKATGRLVVTRSADGNETRESGEMFVAGIRFPTELATLADQKTSRVTFLDIRVNETFDLAMFERPRPTFDFGPAPAAAPEAAAAASAPADIAAPAATPAEPAPPALAPASEPAAAPVPTTP